MLWRSAEGGSLNPADCMQQLLEQVRRHRVNIDGNVCTVIVTTLVLEVTCFFIHFNTCLSHALISKDFYGPVQLALTKILGRTTNYGFGKRQTKPTLLGGLALG